MAHHCICDDYICDDYISDDCISDDYISDDCISGDYISDDCISEAGISDMASRVSRSGQEKAGLEECTPPHTLVMTTLVMTGGVPRTSPSSRLGVHL